MTKAKHTPGPWTVDGDEVWSDETQSSVCMVLHGTGEEANARLIAAAPDMLEAAVMIETAMKKHPDTECSVVLLPGILALRAAITKATGAA